MSATLLTVPLSRLRALPQVRKRFDEESLRGLAPRASSATGCSSPCCAGRRARTTCWSTASAV